MRAFNSLTVAQTMLPDHQRPSLMANWRFAYPVVFMMLSGCGGTINAAPVPSDNPPAYKQIIRAAFARGRKPNRR